MKAAFICAGLLAACSALAQDARLDESLQADISRRAKEGVKSTPHPKPNEIKSTNAVYSGIAVQLAKTDRPLHLINPAAPPEHGAAEDNAVRDPINGRVSGLKLFSVSF